MSKKSLIEEAAERFNRIVNYDPAQPSVYEEKHGGGG